MEIHFQVDVRISFCWMAMKYIDELLTPQIKSENVSFDRLVDVPGKVEVHAGRGCNKVSIHDDGIVVEGATDQETRQGLNYIRQLEILFEGRLPACEFEFFSPAFEYRGFMIDVCRHFMPVDEIKRIVDAMALVGYNHFHWHLTDDQGWRFEVEGYPRLKEVSSKRRNSEYHGYELIHEGIYSNEELADVVRFCTERGVRIVPEIEIPGHSTALLAAYPEFGCTGRSLEVETHWGIFDDVLNPACKEMWTFLDSAIAALCRIFPGPFIHIGGDECPHVQWEGNEGCRALMDELGIKDADELQGWCTTKAAGIVGRHGRRAIGWDEVVDASAIESSVVVMSWRGLEGARKATAKGHNVILCPQQGCYLDKGYTKDDFEPSQWGSYTVKDTFDLDIGMAELGERSSLILGGQCNLWTEQIRNGREAEYMMFPRVFVFSDSLWLGGRKSWGRTSKRKKAMSQLCYNLDLVCSPARWEEDSKSPNGSSLAIAAVGEE